MLFDLVAAADMISAFMWFSFSKDMLDVDEQSDEDDDEQSLW